MPAKTLSFLNTFGDKPRCLPTVIQAHSSGVYECVVFNLTLQSVRLNLKSVIRTSGDQGLGDQDTRRSGFVFVPDIQIP